MEFFRIQPADIDKMPIFTYKQDNPNPKEVGMTAATLRHPTNVLVGFDMGGTVAILKRETMREHTLRVYRDFGMIPKDVSDEKILKTIAEVRRLFEGAGEAHQDRDAFWLAVNTIVLNGLLRNPHHRRSISVYAGRIHGAFLAKEEFMACPFMLDAVRKLRRAGAKAVITSNSTHAEAEGLLSSLGVMQEFDAILTSDLLGARKTEERFWREVARHTFPEGIPEHLVAFQVGNSLFSDGFAARFGWRTIIVDREQRYFPHTERVRLNAQFVPAHQQIVMNHIADGRIRFAKSAERVRNILVGLRGYVRPQRTRSHKR